MEKCEKKYHSPKDVLDAAKSSETSAEELDDLIKYGLPFINEAIVRNGNTTIETLRKLIPDNLDTYNNVSLACALADNAKSDWELLRILAEKLPPFIGNGRLDHEIFHSAIRICCNINTSIDLITGILSHPNTSVEFRKVLARESTRMDVLTFLTKDSNERVKRNAESRMNQL